MLEFDFLTWQKHNDPPLPHKILERWNASRRYAAFCVLHTWFVDGRFGWVSWTNQSFFWIDLLDLITIFVRFLTSLLPGVRLAMPPWKLALDPGTRAPRHTRFGVASASTRRPPKDVKPKKRGSSLKCETPQTTTWLEVLHGRLHLLTGKKTSRIGKHHTKHSPNYSCFMSFHSIPNGYIQLASYIYIYIYIDPSAPSTPFLPPLRLQGQVPGQVRRGQKCNKHWRKWPNHLASGMIMPLYAIICHHMPLDANLATFLGEAIDVVFTTKVLIELVSLKALQTEGSTCSVRWSTSE